MINRNGHYKGGKGGLSCAAREVIPEIDMERKAQDAVPHDITRYAFEAVMAMTERQIKRLTVALVVAILGIVISNLAWLYCWMQYDYSAVDNGVEVSAEAENGGNASYIGTRGMIINGESDGKEILTESDTDTEDIFLG